MSYFGDFIATFLDYQVLKVLHVFGVVIFLGNIIITGWWKTMADRTRNKAIIAFAQRQVTVTDWLFTFTGVLIVGFCGFGMAAHMGEGAFSVTWIQWGYGLFLASGVIWVLILIPLQIILARMARQFDEAEEIPGRYWTLSKQWLIWGTIAILLPLANLYWMIIKP